MTSSHFQVESLLSRPRRNRSSSTVRDWVAETQVSRRNLVQPIFVVDGQGIQEPISSMPGVFRHSIDRAVAEVLRGQKAGISAYALFPKVDDAKKDSRATEGLNPKGLACRAIEAIKHAAPDCTLIADVAMDPYSSDGHDGLVVNGVIDNDQTLEILSEMAVTLARAGADWLGPSDMMDGRVAALRRALDAGGFSDRGIISYCAKYASGFYGPFRDALGSSPKFGDKKTYQMDPRNRFEALREAHLDASEGADLLMVKPALAYLDVIAELSKLHLLPIAAYQVSGEYSMLKAAAERGWLDEKTAVIESLTAIRRAGASVILSYFATDAVERGWIA